MRPPLPDWLRVKVGKQAASESTRELMERRRLCTVCQSARCPNIGECFAAGTATFMLMGNACTRDCRFCAVPHAAGPLPPPDPDEPERVAEAAAEMGLSFVVITSVTRDDLPDGGAAHFAAAIEAVRHLLPAAGIEVLTPDFLGDEAALRSVLNARPTVFNHNVETVRELSAVLRPQADHSRSLQVLAHASGNCPGVVIKSGFMVGVGETDSQVQRLLDELAAAGCRIVTIGQYLQPTRRHHPVSRYVHPDQFETYAQWAKQAGIVEVSAGPFVRSSYRAAESAAAALNQSS